MSTILMLPFRHNSTPVFTPEHQFSYLVDSLPFHPPVLDLNISSSLPVQETFFPALSSVQVKARNASNPIPWKRVYTDYQLEVMP